MSLVKHTILLFCAIVLMGFFIACEKEGPMEKAGKKADQAIEDVQKAIEKKTE